MKEILILCIFLLLFGCTSQDIFLDYDEMCKGFTSDDNAYYESEFRVGEFCISKNIAYQVIISNNKIYGVTK